MTGEFLRNKLKTITLDGKKIVFTDLAKSLGLDRQSLNSRLNAKRIDDNFVIEIATALQIDVNVLTQDGTILNDTDTPYNKLKKAGDEALDAVLELKDLTEDDMKSLQEYQASLTKLMALIKRRKR